MDSKRGGCLVMAIDAAAGRRRVSRRPRFGAACLLAAGLAAACSSSRPPAALRLTAYVDSTTVGSPVTAVHWVEPDSGCFHHATPWAPPEEVLLADPLRRHSFLGIIHWEEGNVPAAQAARDEMQRRLGLDAVTMEAGEVQLRKGYGRRLTLLTTTGLGRSAEDALEAEYRLWWGWIVRSETRERGETSMEFRREILFR
jgi:hypothetical protein